MARTRGVLNGPDGDHVDVDGSKTSVEFSTAPPGTPTCSPPMTSTLPLVSITARCPERAAPIAGTSVNAFVAGSTSAADDTEAPAGPRPPAMRTRPFGSSVAV